MRILIATDNYYPNVNGAAYAGHRLATKLLGRGHEVCVIAPSRTVREERFEHEGIKIYGIPSFPVSVIRVPFFSVAGYAIEQEIKRFKPEVIHLLSHFAVGMHTLDMAKKYKIPTVGTNHFMPENLTHYLGMPLQVEKMINKFAWKHFKHVFEQLGVVTTPTKTAAELLLPSGLKKEVYPISNGIDLAVFRPGLSATRLRNKFNISNKPTMLYVGRLDKEKNIDHVLRAFRCVINDGIDAQFVVAGKGVVAQQLKDLTTELGLNNHVTFTGFVSDDELPNLYHLANVFVIAGTAELQSLVTMEAMASGLPILAVNAVALPELVKDGENGYLFNHGDQERFVVVAKKILSDPVLAETMGKKSLQIVSAHDINSVLGQYELAYQRAKTINYPKLNHSTISMKTKLIFAVVIALLFLAGNIYQSKAESFVWPHQLAMTYSRILRSDHTQRIRSVFERVHKQLDKN
jgi:1,2-diacylglycerol 3-alpha-glucosyltransferase